MTKLREKDLVCAQVLAAECGHSVRSAAQELGVAESTLRYRLKRRADGAEDGRRRRRPPKVRPLRRVEVRPGRQAQVDRVEPWVQVRELGGRTRLSAFSLSLSFSRMWSVQWRLDQGQLSWQEAHNRAFEAVQGVPWSVRFDNCKTAVARRGGPWAILNDYASYARQLGFVPDACRIRRPTDKGQVERGCAMCAGL